MSRGRKPNSSTINIDPSNLFYEYVGSYFQTILSHLGQSNSLISNESSSQLLKEIRSISKKSLPEIDIYAMPFKIPRNWVWCRLGEVIKFTDNLNIHSQFKSNTIINYVDIDAIDNKKYVIREVKQRAVSELSSRARRVLKKGHLVYSLVRPYLNNIAIIEEEKQNFIGSTGFAVFSGIKIENDFIKYYLLSDFIRERYLGMLSGFNSPSITYEQFAYTPFPLAPLEDQKKIISFLKDFELSKLKDNYYFNNSVENNIRKLNAGQKKGIELKHEFTSQSNYVMQLRQSSLREAMQGKLVKQDPKDGHAKDLLEKIKAEKAKSGRREKELPPIKPEEIPFEIPENWVWCRLGEICNYGSSPKAEAKDIKSDTWVLDLEDIEKETSRLLCKIRYSERKSLSTKSVFKNGDVLYSKLRPYLDKVIVADEEGVCTTEILPLKVYGGLNPYLVRYALKSTGFLSYVNSVTKGMKMPRLGTKEGQMALIPLPPLPEQKRIVEKLDGVLRLCDDLQESIQAKREQNELLLQQVLKEALLN